MTGFWNDMCGSLVLDKAPSFPSSPFIEPKVDKLTSDQRARYKAFLQLGSPTLSDLGDALADLANLIQFVEQGTLGNEKSQREDFVAQDLNPVVHRLLSLPRYAIEALEDTESAELRMHEGLRLAALVTVGLIKEYCEIGPTGLQQNQDRLTAPLQESAMDFLTHPALRLWILATYAVASESNRFQHVTQLASAARLLSINSWEDLKQILSNVMWSNRILGDKTSDLGTLFDSLNNG